MKTYLHLHDDLHVFKQESTAQLAKYLQAQKGWEQQLKRKNEHIFYVQ
jgi:hypothetical protein